MANAKTVLLGIHEDDRYCGKVLLAYLKSFGYSSDIASTEKEFLLRVKEARHGVYIQEANQGMPGTANVNPACQTYSLLENRIVKGEAKFAAMSGDEDTLKPLVEKGISTLHKPVSSLDLAVFLGIRG